jgi:hypothetical protein
MIQLELPPGELSASKLTMINIATTATSKVAETMMVDFVNCKVNTC